MEKTERKTSRIVCFVCERERVRAREKEREREGGRGREREWGAYDDKEDGENGEEDVGHAEGRAVRPAACFRDQIAFFSSLICTAACWNQTPCGKNQGN